LDTPVEREKLERMLRAASWSPSGSNNQPWKVYVVQGESRNSLSRKLCELHDAMRDNPELANEYQEAYQYYPPKWTSPYIERRRACGWGLYGTLNIEKGDKERMHEQMKRNYKFFDAPVGIFFTHD